MVYGTLTCLPPKFILIVVGYFVHFHVYTTFAIPGKKHATSKAFPVSMFIAETAPVLELIPRRCQVPSIDTPMSKTSPLQRLFAAASFIDFNATVRAASVNECDIFL